MSILIVTMIADQHTEAVCWALRKSGVDFTKWNFSDFPLYQAMSVRISNNSVETAVYDFSANACDLLDRRVLHGNYAVVWNRRLGRPQIDTSLPRADWPFIARESETARLGILSNLYPNANWINNTKANAFADNKINQLVAAQNIGFCIPDTVVSNNPGDVLTLLEQKGKIVYKPFRTPRWRVGPESVVTATTSVVDKEMILNNTDSIRICPGIFQEYINKKFEVRVVVMGDIYVAGILSQHVSDDSKVDWRRNYEMLGLEKYELPSNAWSSIQKLMSRLDLSFGCIDIAIDDDGKFYFLEINPVGQFLWMDVLNPAMDLLRTFCEFLIDRSGTSRSVPKDVTFSNFLLSPEASQLDELQKSKVMGDRIKYQYDDVMQE